MPKVKPLPTFTPDTLQALLEAGQFYFIDETVSFVLYGAVSPLLLLSEPRTMKLTRSCCPA